MKNKLSSAGSTNARTQQIISSPLFLLLLLFSLLQFSACELNDSGGEGENTMDTALSDGPKVQVAYAGGGWRAHTGHSGWTIALLGEGEEKKSLDAAFANVDAIGSNSGGSWFSTMLTYSDAFRQSLEAPDAYHTWDTTGWLGQQQAIFEKGICDHQSWLDYFQCIFNHIGESEADAGYWNKIVEHIIFRNANIDTTTTLGADDFWADEKVLLIAASLLNKEVVLSEDTGEQLYFYQACLPPTDPEPTFNDFSASCSGASPYVSPVVFTNIAASPGTSPAVPQFFPQLTSSATVDHYTVGYYLRGRNNVFPDTTNIQNPINSHQLSVLNAAAASSAAGGFMASAAINEQNTLPWISGKWDVAYTLEDYALSFKLTDSTAQYIDASKSNAPAQENKIMRIADGGPVDNSGVAQIVKYLQLNGQTKDFNIVAFDNVATLFPDPQSDLALGGDIAYLFGLNLQNTNQFCTPFLGTDFCIEVPEIQIFADTALLNPTIKWRFPYGDDDNKGILYSKYEVTTVSNTTFGIEAGHTGTLHSFTCYWHNAEMAPIPPYVNATFEEYATMFHFIKYALDANGKEGMGYLEAAMGLK